MKSFEELYYEAPSFWQAGAVGTSRFEEIAALLPAGTQNLLDVGCGNGEFGHYLNAVRPEIAVTGVDRSEAALAHVRFDKIQTPIQAIPCADGSFDAVSCLQVIEHLHAPVTELALDQIARIARDLIIIGVPYCEDTAANRTTCPRCKTSFNIDLHLDSFDNARLKTLFDSRGFQFAGMAFPERKQHLWLVDNVYGRIAKMRTKRPEFVSPICPLCGYTQGDRTAISIAEQNPKPAPRRGLRRTVSSAVKRIWPKVEVRGYTVVSVYKRTV